MFHDPILMWIFWPIFNILKCRKLKNKKIFIVVKISNWNFKNLVHCSFTSAKSSKKFENHHHSLIVYEFRRFWVPVGTFTIRCMSWKVISFHYSSLKRTLFYTILSAENSHLWTSFELSFLNSTIKKLSKYKSLWNSSILSKVRRFGHCSQTYFLSPKLGNKKQTSMYLFNNKLTEIRKLTTTSNTVFYYKK